jgi:hypothetical protein
LDSHNISYDEEDIKKTVKGVPTLTEAYLTVEADEYHGQIFRCLPVAHCELNPIELAWASLKGYVAKQKYENFNLT